MPPHRGQHRYQRVAQRVEIVGIAFKYIERKRDIDGKPSDVERIFQLVPVKDFAIEIGALGALLFLQRFNDRASAVVSGQGRRRILPADGTIFRGIWRLNAASLPVRKRRYGNNATSDQDDQTNRA